MDKKQQIEEIGKVMCEEFRSEHCGNDCECDNEYIAEKLYNAGYRKIDDDCAVITKAELKQYKVQAVKEFSERLKTEPRITDSGLEFVALVDIDAELEALLKEYEKWKTISNN